MGKDRRLIKKNGTNPPEIIATVPFSVWKLMKINEQSELSSKTKRKGQEKFMQILKNTKNGSKDANESCIVEMIISLVKKQAFEADGLDMPWRQLLDTFSRMDDEIQKGVAMIVWRKRKQALAPLHASPDGLKLVESNPQARRKTLSRRKPERFLDDLLEKTAYLENDEPQRIVMMMVTQLENQNKIFEALAKRILLMLHGVKKLGNEIAAGAALIDWHTNTKRNQSRATSPSLPPITDGLLPGDPDPQTVDLEKNELHRIEKMKLLQMLEKLVEVYPPLKKKMWQLLDCAREMACGIPTGAKLMENIRKMNETRGIARSSDSASQLNQCLMEALEKKRQHRLEEMIASQLKNRENLMEALDIKVSQVLDCLREVAHVIGIGKLLWSDIRCSRFKLSMKESRQVSFTRDSSSDDEVESDCSQ